MTKSTPAGVTKRTTRGVQLGNMNEAELAKKQKVVKAPPAENSKKIRKNKKGGKSQKDLDKDLRKQYDKGKAYDEDEDDVADRKNAQE